MADRCIAALYPFKINRLRYVEVASGLVLSVYERKQRIAGINGLSFVRFSPTAVLVLTVCTLYLFMMQHGLSPSSDFLHLCTFHRPIYHKTMQNP